MLIGVPHANRQPETEGMIGFFVNTLVLRAELSADPTFLELIAQVHTRALPRMTTRTCPSSASYVCSRPTGT
jgi:non-ribosomal peptide synthetase component F